MKTLTNLEPWRQTWRDGIVPQLPGAALIALADALQHDDGSLIQGVTTSPPNLRLMEEWPMECACAIAFAGWRGCGMQTVGQAAEFFALVMYNCDCRLGHPQAAKPFVDWFDNTPRDQMRQLLLAEVELALSRRKAKAS